MKIKKLAATCIAVLFFVTPILSFGQRLGQGLSGIGRAAEGWDEAERRRQELELLRIQNEAARIQLDNLRRQQQQQQSQGFEWATSKGIGSSGDPMLTQCLYQTLGGYQFSIMQRSTCPLQVQINPMTSQVLVP